MGIITDLVLSYDVTDYVHFRAVCCPWRQCSIDPHAHGVMDRRFHPSRWTMLREEHTTPSRRSFLNTSTGECIQVDVPELRDHEVLAVTAEGYPCRSTDKAVPLWLTTVVSAHCTALPSAAASRRPADLVSSHLPSFPLYLLPCIRVSFLT
ncbi:hypothetical protein ZWY2020_036536 [Hordeum vulgare]|nr:hypothetical protein ZWY2020_036536 [Hordeum vulgare]